MRQHERFQEIDLTTCELACGGRDFGPGWHATTWDDGSQLFRHDNGAQFATTPDGAIFNWGAPRITGDMDAQTVHDNAVWWNDFRDANQLNKVGPDGQEHLRQWTIPGQNPDVQHFAGTHDVYASEAYRQALADGSPQRMQDYEDANLESAAAGAFRAASEGATEGARTANGIFAEYDFYIEP